MTANPPASNPLSASGRARLRLLSGAPSFGLEALPAGEAGR